MPSDASLEITVRLIDKFSKEYNQLLGLVTKGARKISKEIGTNATAFRSLGKEMDRATKSANKMGTEVAKSTRKASKGAASVGAQFKRLSHSIFSLRHVFSTVIAGIVVKGLVKTAGAAEDLDRAFKNLATAGGMDAAEALRGMQEATRGTVHDMDLMRAANNAMLLGVAKSSKDFATLAKAGRILGKAVGRTALQGFEDLALGIGKQSRLILDNLGVIVRAEDAYRKYAATIGKAVDELSDEERRFAFRTAALESVRKKVESLGKDTLSTSEKFAQFWVKIKEVGVQLSEQLAPTLLEVAAALERALPTIKEIVKQFADLAKKSVPPAIKALEGVATVLNTMFKAGQWLRGPILGDTADNAEQATNRAIAGQKTLAMWAEKTRETFRATDVNDLLRKRIELLKELADIEALQARPMQLPKTVPMFPSLGGAGSQKAAEDLRKKAIKKEAELLDRDLARRFAPFGFGAQAITRGLKDPESIIHDKGFAETLEGMGSAAQVFGDTTSSVFEMLRGPIGDVRGLVDGLDEDLTRVSQAGQAAKAELTKIGVTKAEIDLAMKTGIGTHELLESIKVSEQAAVNWKLLAKIADETGNAKLRELAIQGLANKATKEWGDTTEAAAAKVIKANKDALAAVKARQTAEANAQKKKFADLDRYFKERQRIWGDLSPSAQQRIEEVGTQEGFLTFREDEIVREKTIRDMDILLRYTDQFGTTSQKMWVAATAASLRYAESVGTVTEQVAGAMQSVIESTERLLSDVMFDAITGKMKSFKEYMLDFLKDIARALSDLAAQMVVTGIIKGVAGGTIQAGLSNILGLQHGGIVNRPTLAAIGEGGMSEAVVPLPNGRAIPVDFKSGGPEGVVQNITIAPTLNVQSLDGSDAKRVLHREMPWMITEIQRGISIDPHRRAFYRGLR